MVENTPTHLLLSIYLCPQESFAQIGLQYSQQIAACNSTQLLQILFAGNTANAILVYGNIYFTLTILTTQIIVSVANQNFQVSWQCKEILEDLTFLSTSTDRSHYVQTITTKTSFTHSTEMKRICTNINKRMVITLAQCKNIS